MCSIGSVDPTADAGIARDIRVYERLGVQPACVITAVTAQNRRGVAAWARLSSDIVRQQLNCVWQETPPRAVCIGLVPNRPALETIRRFLSALRHRPYIVIDPVIAASSGRRFLRARDVRALLSLFSLATLVTPNVMEATELTGISITNATGQADAARALARHGCAALVTGGHLAGSVCTDVLARGLRVQRFGASRLHERIRGAGGILAAAIASHLAGGATLEAAIVHARRFVRRAIAGAG